jgi:hypothetical protein
MKTISIVLFFGLYSISSIALADKKEELKEQIATIINLNGFLCAKVLDVKPLEVRANIYEVTCIEYSGGSGTKIYILDASKALVWTP